jgi:hypothetical protein
MSEIAAGHGWAVVDSGAVSVQSVAPHRRGAIVNWLWVACQVMVTSEVADEVIEMHWLLLSAERGAKVVQVEVTAIEGGSH